MAIRVTREHDDLAVEPVRGLPEVPPVGEQILWQGQPHWFLLARDALNLYWIAGYFVAFAIWRAVTIGQDAPFWEAVRIGSPFLILGAVTCGLLLAMAAVLAKTTMYTVTNRRVAMRIGAALTITLNLPYRWIGNAALKLRKDGSGTIALELLGDTRLSYLNTWPHVRPLHFGATQPALRCIRDAAHVAKILAEAAETRVSEPVLTRRPMQTAPDQPTIAAE